MRRTAAQLRFCRPRVRRCALTNGSAMAEDVPGPRWLKEFLSGFQAFTREVGPATSDRVAVIAAVASIDRALEMLLRHFFIVTSHATPKDCDALLTKQPIPPLGATAVRVKLAKCLGLLGREEANALAFVVRWRNHYAHEPLPSPITTEIAQGLMDRLPEEARFALSSALSEVPPDDGARLSPRRIFACACMTLHAILLVRADTRFGDAVPGERPD